ncbi:rhodanese-like domain-containing protein [Pseudoalteromonas sp. MMG010]|uniref:rhodanese-like domain-containing protein n=1 Tax=Pseudoalteromonas sp. MMG010 TaxID=2822685 RepID=UPI001B3A4411|nr:rhodanese-like domain-containing protein [Pseudoalteromonas sp. MMG010]MBQ4834355.1 rhodanese-like domain-containing protein [Pseudoalteromonas sp. MMG010]
MLTPIPALIKVITPNQRHLSAEQAKQEISENNGLLIDVREPSEHKQNPAFSAINIPRGVLEMKLMEMEKDPTRAIYLHCLSGARATLSAEALTRVGYKNVNVITCNANTVTETFN